MEESKYRMRSCEQQPGRQQEQGQEPVMILDVALADFLWWQQYRPSTASASTADLLHVARAPSTTVSTCAQVSQAHLHASVERLGSVDGYSAATIARKVAVIRMFFRTLALRGLLSSNPAEHLKGPAIPARRSQRPPTEQVHRLLDPERARTAQQIRDQAMWSLIAEQGMRPSQLIPLQVEDLDLARGLLWLRHEETSQVFVLSQAGQQALERYLREARPQLARRTDEEHTLFLSQQGGPLSRQAIWLRCKHDARVAGLPPSQTPLRLRSARKPPREPSCRKGAPHERE